MKSALESLSLALLVSSSSSTNALATVPNKFVFAFEFKLKLESWTLFKTESKSSSSVEKDSEFLILLAVCWLAFMVFRFWEDREFRVFRDCWLEVVLALVRYWLVMEGRGLYFVFLFYLSFLICPFCVYHSRMISFLRNYFVFSYFFRSWMGK